MNVFLAIWARPDWCRSAVVRLAVVLTTVAAVGVGLVFYAKALSRLDDVASQNSALSFADREIAGGNSVIVDQQAAFEARALIPLDVPYRVVTGTALRNATPLTAAFVEIWFRGFLMPRRPAASGRWIVCYGCDVSKLGALYNVRWHDANGISIGRLG